MAFLKLKINSDIKTPGRRKENRVMLMYYFDRCDQNLAKIVSTLSNVETFLNDYTEIDTTTEKRLKSECLFEELKFLPILSPSPDI